MTEVVGEGVIHIRTDSAGVDVTGAGASAGKGYTKGFLSSMKGLALGIGGVIAAREVIGFAKDAVAEGREAQKVAATTEQIIKSTGGAANVAANQVGELATALSLKTGVDDEAIQSGANLLLTFKNVRNEVGEGNNVFAQAVELTQDVSAAGFGSIESASKSLGKALNDPVKGISALGRAGVTFSAAQQKQIKDLVAQNDLLGAQKIILGEVKSQVGGVAEATATSGEKAKVSWQNLQEQIGTALIPTLDRLEEAFAEKIVPAISGVIDGSSEAGKTIRRAAGAIGDAVGFIQDGLTSDKAGGIFDTIMETAQAAAPVIEDVLGELLTAGKALAEDLLPVMADTFQNDVLPAVIGLVSYAKENLLPVFLDIVDLIAHEVVPTLASIAVLVYGTLYPALIAIVTTVLTKLKPVFDQLIETFRRDVLPTLSDLVTTIRTQLIPALQPIVEKVLIVVGAVLKLAAAILAKVLPPLIQLAGFIIRNLVPIIATIIVKAVEFVGWILNLGGALKAGAQHVIDFANKLRNIHDKINDFLASIPGLISGFAGDMKDAGADFIGGLFDGILEAAGAVGGVVEDIASSVLDAVKGLINDAIDLINDGIPDKIGIPGAPDINLPNNPIPHLAGGTSNWPGGWSWVGEEGPELVNLPRRAQVFPAGQSRAMAGRGEGGVVVQFLGAVMPHNYSEFIRQAEDAARVAGLGTRRPIAVQAVSA